MKFKVPVINSRLYGNNLQGQAVLAFAWGVAHPTFY